MSKPKIHQDTRDFFLGYFMRNNVELDILRVVLFANTKEQRPYLKEIKKRSVFPFIDSNLISKLKNFRFIGQESGYFLRYRGYIALAHIAGVILDSLWGKSYEVKELAQKLFDEGFCLGGRTKDFQCHTDLLEAFLGDLTRNKVLKHINSKYSLAEEEERCGFACSCLSKLIDLKSINLKSELDETVECFRSCFLLKDFSIGYLMKKLESTTLTRARHILSSTHFSENLIVNALRARQKEAISEKDWLASAAYWHLQSSVHEEAGDVEGFDFCKSRCFISLAIHLKRNNDLARAAEYYEKASEIMARYPRYSKKANLQLANSLMCKGKMAVNEANFAEASVFYKKASRLFSDLGMAKESTFCEFRNFESQARENASRGEYLAATKIMNKAAEVMKDIPKRHIGALAWAKVYEARHFEKVDDLDKACNCFSEASKLFENAELPIPSSWSRGHHFQTRAISLRNSKAQYGEIAKMFAEAATHYAKGESLEAARVCEADSLKFQGLEALQTANWKKAISNFNLGKMIYRELILTCSDPLKRDSYRMGETWFEAMRIEATANEKLLTAIAKKGNLGEVMKLLTHAADLFTRVGDFKHAEIDSSFTLIVAGIDAFHKGDSTKADSLIREAKNRLPRDFVFSMLESEVKSGWEPLRYTLGIMKDFDRYARKIETEKGFSFESRMRELLTKMHRQYRRIEPKTFAPERDEIGIVFNDKTPIEIDAIGTREQANKLFLLIAEMKNISDSVEKRDIALFLRKVQFVEKRYSKIAKLQGLKKPAIENKLYISRSGFDPAATTFADKNNIKLLDKGEINKLLRKYQMFRLPE